MFPFSIPLKFVGQNGVDLACKEKLERNQDFQLPFHIKNKTNNLVTLLQRRLNHPRESCNG